MNRFKVAFDIAKTFIVVPWKMTIAIDPRLRDPHLQQLALLDCHFFDTYGLYPC